MKRTLLYIGLAVLVVCAVVWTGVRIAFSPDVRTVTEHGVELDMAPLANDASGFIYGIVTTTEGASYRGRIRFGKSEESFWTETFNGYVKTNPWTNYVPEEVLQSERRSIFGLKIGPAKTAISLRRPFMVRMGEISRIDADATTVDITLKSGAVHTLDRLSTSDFDDGVRVWNDEGAMDLGPRGIRSIVFESTPDLPEVPARIRGTVTTESGTFTGFIQWDRESGVGTDTLDGSNKNGRYSIPFHSIRSLERHPNGALVRLRDGSERILSQTRDTGTQSRGIYVDDERYGRVLLPWDIFERVDLETKGSGPGYESFPAGRLLQGRATTLDGRTFTGRLVYDLDETETIQTLDATHLEVDYSIPFRLIDSIILSESDDPVIMLSSGEELLLDRNGDLADDNGGLLVFTSPDDDPEYLPWLSLARIDFLPGNDVSASNE